MANLDKFRSVNLKLDEANDYQIKPQFAKQGDYNGRDLIIQITNGGEIEDQSKVTLHLGWKHATVGNQGLDPFEAIKPEKGIFKITYPSEMLNPGTVVCAIQIIDADKITLTRNFKLEVEKSPFDDETIVSDNSFTALQEALMRVEDIEASEQERQDTFEANEADRESTFDTNESNRQNTFEDNEQTRQANENTRISNENVRKTAESERVAAEDTRESQESSRVSAENSRTTAESTRETNESSRVSAESSRVSAESSRDTNEKNRQNAEQERESNETAREQTFNNLVNDLEGLEDDYAPRLSEIEGRYIWFAEEEEW